MVAAVAHDLDGAKLPMGQAHHSPDFGGLVDLQNPPTHGTMALVGLEVNHGQLDQSQALLRPCVGLRTQIVRQVEHD